MTIDQIKANDKGRRNELTRLKYKKRLKIYQRQPGEWFALKSHGSPCSCGICRGEKYRNRDRQKNKVNIMNLEYDGV